MFIAPLLNEGRNRFEVSDRELNESNLAWQTSLKGYQSIYLEVLEQRRDLLHKMNRRAEFDIFKNPEILIALEEYKRHLEKHCL
ncbi:MAG: hypothetical protein KME15_25195 [Drouetiella hepatica Uher 2000/2452]|uniref:Uncharacterized protein n=1 Tax=Drouetiella hepatica Uher 2000/2452 TaxID=904376 RepID=A0A951UQ51_9CYAN|nr:hypothetical protein [Drouetiella hepatica Uher 2000/2452]